MEKWRSRVLLDSDGVKGRGKTLYSWGTWWRCDREGSGKVEAVGEGVRGVTEEEVETES